MTMSYMKPRDSRGEWLSITARMSKHAHDSRCMPVYVYF